MKTLLLKTGWPGHEGLGGSLDECTDHMGMSDSKGEHLYRGFWFLVVEVSGDREQGCDLTLSHLTGFSFVLPDSMVLGPRLHLHCLAERIVAT